MAGEEESKQRYSMGSVPIPDPTVLTTELVDRALAIVEKLFDSKISELRNEVGHVNKELKDFIGENRALIQSNSDISKERIAHLEKLQDEKFKGMDRRFQDSKDAVDKAFAAAKEAVTEQNKSNTTAVDKTERNVTEQMKQQAQMSQTSIKALEDKIVAVKEFQAASTGHEKGSVDSRAYFVAAIGIAIGIIGLVFAGMTAMHH
jgi:hypothetical protein